MPYYKDAPYQQPQNGVVPPYQSYQTAFNNASDWIKANWIYILIAIILIGLLIWYFTTKKVDLSKSASYSSYSNARSAPYY